MSEASGQVIDIETFDSGSYPGPALPAGRTTYNYNAVSQPANWPNILQDGDYVLATDSQQGFSSWASIGDHTTGSGYMFLVNADDNQAGEFYRGTVPLTANTSYDFKTYLVNVNSQGDFDYCTNNEGGLVLPNVTMQIEGPGGAIIATNTTGAVPWNATPVWDEYQISFTTPANTASVDIVLINNSIGGCGNDLAIDDITFQIAVTMEAADETITLTDTSTAQNAVLTLGTNDTLDGNPLPGTENYTLASGFSLPAGISLDGNTGEVGVAAGTPNGTYTFDYQVCETPNMYNCAIATATIIVDTPPLPITAADDSGSVADSSTGPTPVLNVLDNDAVNNAAPSGNFDLSIAFGSSLPSALTFDTMTGEVVVLQGAPTGIYTFDYEICEAGDPTNCETATVTIDVTNPNGGSFCPAGTSAFPGTYNVVSATGGQNPNRAVGAPLTEGSTDTGGQTAITYYGPITMDLTGDPLISVPEGEVIEVSLSSAWGNQARAEILTSVDGATYTSLGTAGNGGSVYGAWTSNIMRYDDFTVPVGGARFLQVLQQNQGVRADGVIYGAQCQESAATPLEILAVPESFASIDGSAGGVTSDVLASDMLDGTAVTLADVTLSVQTSAPELTLDPATGLITVAAGTAAGTYTVDYEICEIAEPTNCAVATETVTVITPAPELTLTKTADDNTDRAAGETIIYTYTASNTGDVDITDVTVSDVHNGSGSLSAITIDALTNTSGDSSDDAADNDIDILAPGDIATFEASYVVTAADVSSGGPITNTATVTGTPLGGTLTDPTASESVSLLTPTLLPPPLPSLDPGVCGGVLAEAYLLDGMGIGQERAYQLASGSATHDPDVFFGTFGTEPGYTKNADGSVVYYFDGEAPVQTISSDVNTPAAIGNITSVGGSSADQTDAAEFWRIAARVDGIPGETYTYTLDNGNAHELLHYWLEDSAGNVIDSTIGDPNTANGWLFGTGQNASTSSANGATSISALQNTPISYTIPASSSDGVVYLRVLIFDPQAAWGRLNFGDAPECPLPELALTKVADDNTDRAIGEMITYTYTAENTGNINIADVTVSDVHNGSGSLSPITIDALTNTSGDSSDDAADNAVDVLAPGDSVTFEASYIVTEADALAGAAVTNTATVTGTPPVGTLTDQTASESVTISAPTADLAVTKTNTTGANGEVDQANDTLTSGDVTTYTLTVTNNGPDGVTGAVVSDVIGTGLTCAGTDPVSLTGDGVPTGSFTIADLTGAGITLGRLEDTEATVLTYSCTVN